MESSSPCRNSDMTENDGKTDIVIYIAYASVLLFLMYDRIISGR